MKSPIKLTIFLSMLVLCVASANLFAQTRQFPTYSGHVNDFANVIDSQTKQTMETILLNFEKKTGTQIAVVTMDTLGGQPLEDYSTDLFRAWGIGSKSGENRDKGALLLVVIKDRKTRLEVGYGLEGDLPDGMAGEIIRNMRPDLQSANYSQAMMKGMRTIVDTLAAKWNVSIEGIEDRRFAARGAEPIKLSGKAASIIFFLLIAFIILMSIIGRSARRRASIAGEAIWWLAPLIFNRGGGNFGGGSWGSSGGDSGGWGGGDSGGSDWGGFGGGESGGGGASDSW